MRQEWDDLVSSSAEATEFFSEDELEEFASGGGCQMCGNQSNNFLGSLGILHHYRCRNCGWQWSKEGK